MAQAQSTLDDGRVLQFEEMMEKLNAMKARYKGVRGALLDKVREELMSLKPSRGAAPAAAPAVASPANVAANTNVAPLRTPPPMKAAVDKMLPSCRSCGRSMKQREDGVLVCQNGHTRQLAG